MKQKKKQTVACDACKKRRRKCTGTMPCAYCAEKGCECNYSQQHKRGKRKLSERTENIGIDRRREERELDQFLT